MNKKIIFLISFLILIGISSIGFFYFKGQDDFIDVNSILIKSSIKQGESITQEFKIMNKFDKEQTFHVSIQGEESLISLSENQFNLNPGEKKMIIVEFNDLNLSHEPGVYVGNIVITSNGFERKLPFILEIQTTSFIFATNLEVAPNYNEISPGEKSVTEIRFFNLQDSKSYPVEMQYLIKDFNENSIFSEQENIVVSSNSKISKTFLIPENTMEGNYVFIATTKYNGFSSSSSYFFSVKKEPFNLFDNSNFLIFLIFIFLIGIILLVFYMFYERNKLFVKLKNQHKSELKRNLDVINSCKKDLNKIKDIKNRKKKIENLNKKKKIILENLKQKHKQQNKEFKNLNKKGKKQEIEKKLESWKNQGYKISELQKSTGLSKKDLERKFKSWKNQGYKF